MEISYGRVVRLPNVLALLAATCLTRLAGRMFAVVIVFHTLAAFGSPSLTGWVSFAAMVPGLIVSPLAGAFLDRAGAARGIVADLAISTALTLALAAAIVLGRATAPVLLLLAATYALTTPLSTAGIRTLLPRIVPVSALDRANGLDTAIHAIVGVAGPAVGGALIGFGGAVVAFVAIAVIYAAATVCVWFVRGIANPEPTSQDFFRQALDGLKFVFFRPLLRGLAVGYALNLVTWGILVVAVPVIAAQYFTPGIWEPVSGLLWAGSGVCGGIGALAAGQSHIRGREVRLMTISMTATAITIWPIAASFGLSGLALGLALAGFLAGAIDVAVLTLRQRRTDPAQLGRVLAVSISANMSGFPIGTALGGMLVAWSPPSALLVAALASLLAALATRTLIPAEDAVP
jgi:MFS family permease